MSEATLGSASAGSDLRVWPRCLDAVAAAIAAVGVGIVAHDLWPGSALALMLLPPLALLACRHAKLGFSRASAALTAVSALSLFSLLLTPNPLALAFHWMSLAGLALSLNGFRFETLSTLMETLLRNLASGPRDTAADFKSAVAARKDVLNNMGWIVGAVLPLAAVLVFGGLLSFANPVIGDVMANLPLRRPLDFIFSQSLPLTLASFLMIWTALRASPAKAVFDYHLTWDRPQWHATYFKVAPVIVTLLLLNLMFAVENALDLAFFWRGGILSNIVATKDYVHRGAYMLIATALLAGALIIAMLQDGTPTAESRIVRILIYAWSAQNLLLVVSSIKRVEVYIDDYGMTMWRLSSLLWMALVAAGLALIALRIVLKRSNVWLLNANLAVALALLLAVMPLDLRGFVANWNADARIARLQAAMPLGHIDLNYDASLGVAALPAFERLIAARDTAPVDKLLERLQLSRADQLRDQLRRNLGRQQSDWRSWTWAGSRLQTPLPLMQERRL
jgi:Domain of unknown function (DUF4173)